MTAARTAFRSGPARAGGERRAAVDALALTRADSLGGVVRLDVLGVLLPPAAGRFGPATAASALESTEKPRVRTEGREREPCAATTAPLFLAPSSHVSFFREKLAGGGRASQSKNATRLSHSTPRVAGTAQNSNLAFRSSAVSLWFEVISG
jgi:hypothetical protein